MYNTKVVEPTEEEKRSCPLPIPFSSSQQFQKHKLRKAMYKY